MQKRAQGTIEYLVIIAVVVVISLVVVSILTGFLGTGSQVGEQSSKISNWSNLLAITETSVGPDGNYLVRLANNSSDPITIANVQVGDTNVNFSEDLFMGGAQNFIIPSSDVCSEGENATRQVKVTYYSKYGVQKTETYPASNFFDCESYSVNLLADRCPAVGGSGCTLTGDAEVTDVLDGKFFYNNDSDTKLEGTLIMPDPGFGFIEFSLPSYSDNEDGTVTDSANGLVWQASTYGPDSPLSWQAAMDYCDITLNEEYFAGYSNWRLPNMAEIGLLYNYSSSSMYESGFDNPIFGYNTWTLWSSTSVTSFNTDAYILNNGSEFFQVSTSKSYEAFIGARCVRTA
ncbi:MAG: DUF1566 domain-containing protein [archaeon]|jgi:hypothetical protein